MEQKLSIYFVSLGCDKNLTDSEEMLGRLIHAGCTICDDEAEADVIIVNTCCFIGDAREESIDTILELAEYRNQGQCRKLIVTGCMAERYKDEIRQELPEVDAVIGTASYDEIVNAVMSESLEIWGQQERLVPMSGERILTGGGHTAYLKISEGCNKHCTYCAIPGFRGPYRSYPMDDLLTEARRLVDLGVRELILVAQETSVYGVDLTGKKELPALLSELEKISELEWIRILYCYPEEITAELVDVIAGSSKICHYLDLPIQHCNDRILGRMGRKTTKKQLSDLIHMLRERIPDICLRTTLIAGFPGEGADEFEELKAFVGEMRFDRLGVFAYSPEDGTPAAEFPGQNDEKTKESRRDELMLLQQEICADKCSELIGETMPVMIEGKLTDEDVYVGRTYRDAPKVDGYCFVQTPYELMSGEFVNVHITDATEYDLIGELEDGNF